MTDLARSVLAATLIALAAPAAAAPANYQYTGNLFDTGVLTCPQCQVHGALTLPAALPANLPSTDLSASITSFSFTDVTPSTPPTRGSGTLTQANAAIRFHAQTNALGQIAVWDLAVTATGGSPWLEATGPSGSPADIGVSQFGGYDGAALHPGTWTALPPPAPVPVFGRLGLWALGLLLLAVSGTRRRAPLRTPASAPRPARVSRRDRR